MTPQTGYILLWQGHTWLSKAIRQIMAYWNLAQENRHNPTVSDKAKLSWIDFDAMCDLQGIDPGKRSDLFKKYLRDNQ